ncbi:MAG: hypothetical protein KJ607_01430 [Bacteroidetes bacterium]|nr:hypothetical protein [Bacteroidota bacterium]
MKKLLLTSLICALTLYVAEAQNIAVTDDDGYSAHSSAMLDVKATGKGILIPRLTTAQRTSITGPATGLLVFDSDQGNFYFHNGTEWISLTSGTNSVWTKSGTDVFLTAGTDKVGVGTSAPFGKLEVRGDVDVDSGDPLFEVLNSNGDTVFAVYSQGVRVSVADDPPAKASGSRSGFAVGGFSLSKGITNEYLRVTPDSVRIYIDESGGSKATGSRGGFAVGGFSLSKESTWDYFNISGADSAEVINPPEARVVWYPTKQAFLTGNVLIESPDSVGTNSTATGNRSKAVGDYSQAFGDQARAFGNNSTAIGYDANAIGDNSYAFGNNAMTSDTGSYAIGTGAQATGLRSFAIGSQGILITGFPSGPTVASGDYSYAFGMGSQSIGQGAFTFGTQDTASGNYATSIGYQTKASGQIATSIGGNTHASGGCSVAMGYNTSASGSSAISMGTGSLASGYVSTAMGNNTVAGGDYSTAMGFYTTATDNAAVAMGYQTDATNLAATSMGYGTTASGINSLATGESTVAGGYASTAMGRAIMVTGEASFGIGLDWTASYTLSQDNTMAVMDGYVGIGTVTPDKMLHVAGDARVEGNIYYGTGASTYNKPDFVFTPEYKKQFDILDIERFIQKNGHLPWITAAEDEKDGVNFTRMGFEMLEAVENLQLQIIELKKENEKLQMEIEKINANINNEVNK